MNDKGNARQISTADDGVQESVNTVDDRWWRPLVLKVRSVSRGRWETRVRIKTGSGTEPLNIHKNTHSSPTAASTHTPPPPPKWWNWSCPISNQAVSNSLIWVYKQLHTSPPQFSRLFTHCIHLPHSFSSQPCVCASMDSPAKTSGCGWGTPKWDSSLPAAPSGPAGCTALRHVSRSRRQTSLSSASPEPPQITLHYSQHAIQFSAATEGLFSLSVNQIIVLLINRLNVTARAIIS